uniref:Uncharacterized protein n=1 Tax=Anguilla anguilla TaxID=7936 RepID=A0A0E9P9J2_ANGAN
MCPISSSATSAGTVGLARRRTPKKNLHRSPPLSPCSERAFPRSCF